MLDCDEDEFYEGLSSINDKISDLRQWFLDNKQETFNELMIKINSAGALKSKIGHIDWTSNTPFTTRDQKYFFENKYFGNIPDEDKLKKTIKKMENYEKEH